MDMEAHALVEVTAQLVFEEADLRRIGEVGPPPCDASSAGQQTTPAVRMAEAKPPSPAKSSQNIQREGDGDEDAEPRFSGAPVMAPPS